MVVEIQDAAIFEAKSGSRLVFQLFVHCQLIPARRNARRTISVDTLNR
jgi:hypothetical protein